MSWDKGAMFIAHVCSCACMGMGGWVSGECRGEGVQRVMGSNFFEIPCYEIADL